MDYSRLLQESNLAARQPQGATSVIQAITSEGLAQGPYVAARGRVEPTTFCTEDTDNLHLTNHANNIFHYKRVMLHRLPASQCTITVVFMRIIVLITTLASS